jgi:hypothetical protein
LEVSEIVALIDRRKAISEPFGGGSTTAGYIAVYRVVASSPSMAVDGVWFGGIVP